jgi:hypothetical protein
VTRVVAVWTRAARFIHAFIRGAIDEVGEELNMWAFDWRRLSAKAAFHVALVLVAAQSVLAQGEAVKLQPVPDAKYPGVRVATAQGYTDKKGQAFSVTGLAVSQPILLYVSESTFGRRVRVDLAKFDDFLAPLRTCQTTPTGPCLIRTRTDEDLFVRVRSLDQEPIQYLVALWTGAESKVALPSLFTPGRAAAARPDSSAASVLPAAPKEPTAGEQMTAKFFAFDTGRKMLVVKDAVGTSFEFALPIDASLTVSGTVVRAGEYLGTHFNNLPYASDQQLRIAWKPSANGKGRVVVAIR